MQRASLDLPDVTLGRSQRIVFAIVALFIAFAVLRVSPDFVRAFYPLYLSGYATNSAGVVDWVARDVPIPYRDIVRPGDRIVIGRVPPFDRKPGLVGSGYSRDNPIHTLPIERNRRIEPLRVGSRPETVASRVLACIRVAVYLLALLLAAMLVLVRPNLATAAIFVYCLGADAPTSFSEVVLDNPWQPIPIWVADVLHGAVRPALLCFALALVWNRGRMTRVIAIACASAALLLGNANAYIDWLATYAGTPRPAYHDAYVNVCTALTILAVAAFLAAVAFAATGERRRIGSIAAAFALAGLARVASDAFYPSVLAPWQNGILQTLALLPIGVVWFSVIRHRAFEVDFVVSRAIVYVAISAAVIGSLTYIEEIATYVFYQKVDVAYGVLVVFFTFVGMGTGRITAAVRTLVDRFVFRDRHDRCVALAFISGYILEAEHVDDVYRALLVDVCHALSLQFAGILERDPSGEFVRTHDHTWPPRLATNAVVTPELVAQIARSREMVETKTSAHLSIAAPLMHARVIPALIVYGRNVSGLNLDAREREALTRLIAHASLAITSIELAEARAALVPDALIPIESGAPERIG